VRRLPADWSARDATEVAPDLLYRLVDIRGRLARVTEVEAYTADDPASHSFSGRTARNSSMFGAAGHWYVYLIYGIHHCINLVTGSEGDGQAVLIRAVVVDGLDPRTTSGPGRLTRALGVDRSLDGAPAAVFDDGLRPPNEPIVTPRIGISKAADLPRRWLVATPGQSQRSQ